MKVGSSRRSLEGLNQEVSSSFENCEFGTSPKVFISIVHVVCVCVCVCVCSCVGQTQLAALNCSATDNVS